MFRPEHQFASYQWLGRLRTSVGVGRMDARQVSVVGPRETHNTKQHFDLQHQHNILIEHNAEDKTQSIEISNKYLNKFKIHSALEFLILGNLAHGRMLVVQLVERSLPSTHQISV